MGDLTEAHRAAITRANAHIIAATRLLRDSLAGRAPTSDWPTPFKNPTH